MVEHVTQFAHVGIGKFGHWLCKLRSSARNGCSLLHRAERYISEVTLGIPGSENRWFALLNFHSEFTFFWLV